MQTTDKICPARSLVDDRVIKAEIEAAWRAGMLTHREAVALAARVNWR